MSKFLQQGFRWFHPIKHTWIRATPTQASRNSNRNLYSLEIGLTERGLQDIGDLTMMKRMVASDMPIKRGHELVNIEWEGHSITCADELYHTVWETFSGSTLVESPVTGVVDEIHTVSPSMCFDEETVLIKMTTTQEDFENATTSNDLVKEPEYLKILQSLPPGRFAESE